MREYELMSAYVFSSLETILNCLLKTMGALAGLYYVWSLVRVWGKEQTILEIKKELSELPARVRERVKVHLVNQSQLERMIAEEAKPKKERMEILETERRFILDRLPFLRK